MLHRPSRCATQLSLSQPLTFRVQSPTLQTMSLTPHIPRSLARVLLAATLAACAAPANPDGGITRTDASDATTRLDAAPVDVQELDSIAPQPDGMTELDTMQDRDANVSMDGAVCGPNLTNCGLSGCVNTNRNARHCGACDRACPIGEICAAGVCGLDCPAPNRVCGAAGSMSCVDVQTDSTNCGRCGVSCPMGQVCVAGACRIDCPAPNRVCTVGAVMTCIDTQSDNLNCGSCGTACPRGRACQRGVCECPVGATLCGATCSDLSNDPLHCGACPTACAAGQQCVSGVCRVGCPAPNQLCGAAPMQMCVNPQTDANNCGMCGAACMAPNATPGCAAGRCQVAACNAGFGNCDGLFANGCEVATASSATHCGRCGNVCPSPPNTLLPLCLAGACSFRACTPGFANCDANAANGCETSVFTDTSNCGRCGNACPIPINAAPSCARGVCGLASCNAGFGNCDANAANGCETSLQNDVSNCGACGNVCPVLGGGSVTMCTAGLCSFSCARGFGDCDRLPANGCETNVYSSPTNCGSCGISCRLGLTCVLGSCR